MKVKWYGHAAFRLLPADGPTVITDPYTPEWVGYAPIADTADLVLLSAGEDGGRRNKNERDNEESLHRGVPG